MVTSDGLVTEEEAVGGVTEKGVVSGKTGLLAVASIQPKLRYGKVTSHMT